MKKRKTEVVVKVNTPNSMFSSEMFGLFELSGQEEPFLTVTHKQIISKSAIYTVFGEDLERVYEVKKNSVESYYLPSKCFILIEQGTIGFDVDNRLFSCKAKIKADELIVDIIEEQEKLAELAEFIEEKFATLREKFYESSANAVIREINKTNVYDETAVQNVLHDFETSKFLCVSDENDTEFRCINNMDEKVKVKTARPSGFFTPLCENEKMWQQDLLMIEKRDAEGTFTIEKPIERMHDIEGDFWLKTKVLYRYPQDKQRLSKELPKLYEQVAKRGEKWREFEQLKEKPKIPILGDLDILLPCTHMKCKAWWMDKDIFHFTLNFFQPLPPEVSAERGKLMCINNAVSVVNYNGRDYFAVFKSKNNKRLGKDVFAHYVFHKLIPVSDAANNEYSFYGHLFLAYLFQIYRNKLKPHTISEETFNKFDLADDLSEKKSSEC